jgi:hypothetical protein
MTLRIFSKSHNLYTNSPLWPSNQRTFSEWCIYPSGEICELIFADEGMSCGVQIHDQRNFIVEPWTGYFDTKGKKIYRGDILGAFKGVHDEIDPSYETEVVWHEGGFYCKDEQTVPDSWMPLDIENRAWKRHFIKGNVHGVEYSD